MPYGPGPLSRPATEAAWDSLWGELLMIHGFFLLTGVDFKVQPLSGMLRTTKKSQVAGPSFGCLVQLENSMG